MKLIEQQHWISGDSLECGEARWEARGEGGSFLKLNFNFNQFNWRMIMK